MTDDTHNAVERELRMIDDDFTHGRMNAFGESENTQDDIINQLKKVGEFEKQIFFMVSGLIRSSADSESLVYRTLAEFADFEALQRQEGEVFDSPEGELQKGRSKKKQLADGQSTKIFEDIGKMFREKETALRQLGSNLRLMAQHLATVSDKVHQIQLKAFPGS